MKVILLDKLTNLGELGEQITVKTGYARNFLIPRGKAIPATKQNITYVEEQRTKYETELLKIKTLAEVRATKIKALGSITITAQAGHGGKLFGSIGQRDIVAAMQAVGVNVTKHEVRLPKGVLRTTGDHEVYLNLHREVLVSLTVVIVATD